MSVDNRFMYSETIIIIIVILILLEAASSSWLFWFHIDGGMVGNL